MTKDVSIQYKKPVKLDEKDKKILQILMEDARLSVAGISRKTGIQRDSVLYRMNKMKKQGVIRCYHILLDPAVLGYPIYSYVNFRLYNLTKEKESKFISFLKAHPKVVYVTKTIGNYDIVSAIAAKNLNHFDKIMEEIRLKFPEIIKDFETASIIQEHKYDDLLGLVE